MTQLSDDEIFEALDPYYATATHHLCDQIRCYIGLLLRWSSRLSLTTITNPQDILRFHFGESLFAVDAVPIRHGRLADVGTGAGFPAIPIRMVNTKVRLTLVESNRKKAVFLSEVIRALNLTDVEVFSGRMQDLSRQKDRFDMITSRAFRADDELLQWSNDQLADNGLLILWTTISEAEKIAVQPRWMWRRPALVPSSERRAILVGSKID